MLMANQFQPIPGASRRIRRSLGTALLLGASLAALTPAQAQAPADAAPEAPSDEIIVTAQKREQNLQDVAVAVSAVSGSKLQDAHIENLEGLQTLVPNLSFGSDFNIAKIFIRGVGMNVSTNGTDPAVAVYVDGAVISRPEAQFASLFDMERVEVLRGPQGTLFGRNAVGGAVNLITAKPTHDLTGYARFTVGNYGEFMTEDAISGPITDGIYARAAGRIETRNGYGKNIVTGNDIDDLNKQMGRLELMFDKGGPLTFLLTGEYYHEHDHANAIKYVSPAFPGIPALGPLGAGGFAPNVRDLASNYDPVNYLQTWSITGTLDWKANDWLAFRSITNYRKVNQTLIQDLDASSVVNSPSTNGQASTIQSRNPFSRQWSEELQALVSTHRFDGVFGFFYFNEDLGSLPNFVANSPTGVGDPLSIPALRAAGIPVANPVQPYFNFYNDLETSRAWAVFADLTYHLSDQFVIKAGGRFSHERRTLENHGYIIGNNGKGPYLPRDFSDAKSFDDFSPKAGIEYHPNDDVMLYYTFSMGFKSGTGEISLSANPITNPERITSHEVGIKSQFLDRKITLNVAAFLNKLRGLQLERTFYDPVLSFRTTYENATATKAYGVEVDSQFRFSRSLRLNLSGAYLHSTFEDYFANDPLDPRNIAGSPVFDPANTDLSGNYTRYSPKWTFSAQPQYELFLPNDGRVIFATDISYKSRQYHTEFNTPALSQAPYTFVNGSIRYEAPGGQFSVDIFANNLFDKLERGGSFSLSTSREIGATYLPPRTFGATIGYRF